MQLGLGSAESSLVVGFARLSFFIELNISLVGTVVLGTTEGGGKPRETGGILVEYVNRRREECKSL